MAPPPARQFSGIFISYRRDDASGHAGRLCDRLGTHFGNDQIFMDIDHIEPGEDFVQVLENAVGSCEILIAIIGRNWLSGADETSRWLDNPNDFVRLEIAAALNRDVRVIPVLVQRATMPKPQDLPEDLTRLSRRQALELSDNRWQRDVDQLITAIEKIRDLLGVLPQPIPQPEPKPEAKPLPKPGPLPGNRTWFIVGATFIVVMVIAVVWYKQRSVSPTKPPVSATANLTPSTNEPAKKLEPPPGMVYVRGGEFTMGRDDGDVAERPAHPVPSVRPFFMDQHEVTRNDYAEFIRSTGHHQLPGWVDGNDPAALALKPVTGVTWAEARDYCEQNHKRLPSEEEWEFAARGADGRRYPWGNNWQPGIANVDHAADGIADVETYKGTSPFGVFDMVGNAWEWTASDMRAYPGGRLPSNLPAGELKVIRGGSYQSTKDYATTTYRTGWPSSNARTYEQTGFRCVKDATN